MTPINSMQGILQGSGINLPNNETTQAKNVPSSQNAQAIQQSDNLDSQNNQNTPNFNASFQDMQKQIEDAIKKLTENLSYLNTHLNIQIDNKINTLVVKIVDNKTNQVIREIPPDYVIRIAEAINNLIGLFVDKKV